jgi:hypothetical protein
MPITPEPAPQSLHLPRVNSAQDQNARASCALAHGADPGERSRLARHPRCIARTPGSRRRERSRPSVTVTRPGRGRKQLVGAAYPGACVEVEIVCTAEPDDDPVSRAQLVAVADGLCCSRPRRSALESPTEPGSTVLCTAFNASSSEMSAPVLALCRALAKCRAESRPDLDHAPVSPVAAFTAARVLALAVPNRWGPAADARGHACAVVSARDIDPTSSEEDSHREAGHTSAQPAPRTRGAQPSRR